MRVLVAVLMLLSSFPLFAEPLYRVKPNTQPMGCNDRLITSEINYALQHPKAISDAHFASLSQQGNCAPILTKQPFEVVQFLSFQLPIGLREEAYVKMTGPYGDDYFYLMKDDIIPVTPTAP